MPIKPEGTSNRKAVANQVSTIFFDAQWPLKVVDRKIKAEQNDLV